MKGTPFGLEKLVGEPTINFIVPSLIAKQCALAAKPPKHLYSVFCFCLVFSSSGVLRKKPIVNVKTYATRRK